MRLNVKILAVAALLGLACNPLWAGEGAPAAKQPDPKQVAADIFKKCMSQAHQIRDEQVCNARKPSIEECVEKQTKAKDAKTAKAKCETLFLSQ
jgi:hypothetical protein